MVDKLKFDDELRDNSKTFTLQGCYSSRLDIKRLNIETSHKLDLANRYVRFCKAESKYSRIIDYAYKMLLQNQAHDSICGCSTDDVHAENIIRYKKIMQIASTIIDELKFETNFEEKMVLNLADKNYTGTLEFSSAKEHKEFEKLYSKKGFDKKLLANINKIPVTEDYIDINQYLVNVENLEPDQIEFIMPEVGETDLYISDKLIKNDKIKNIWLFRVGEPLPTDGGNQRLLRMGLIAEELKKIYKNGCLKYRHPLILPRRLDRFRR